MTIIFFSGNLHKAREVEAIFAPFRVRIYTDFMQSFSVIESGKTFAENAKIKLDALKNAINSQGFENIFKGENCILMAEDSGICVESLNNLPNIFSARFANLPTLCENSLELPKNLADSSDSQNLARLIAELKARNLSESKAQFISCVACCKLKNITNRLDNRVFLTTHGFLNGKVICEPRGKNGFGYDPIFVPNGYKSTLAEMPSESKNALSHRKNALSLMRLILCPLSAKNLY